PRLAQTVACRLGGGRCDLPREAPQRLTEFRGTAEAVTGPERHAARLTERGHDVDAVVRDRGDAPARGAQREHVLDAILVDHLLVELAHTRVLRLARDEHPEQTAIRDRTAARDRESLSARPSLEDAAVAIPHDARTQLGELVRGIPSGKEVHRRLEGAARKG